jgi:glucosamine--fructose-6-phosphate aminotransferase (isomerizing)
MIKMWEEIFEQPDVLKRCLENNDKLLESIVEDIKGRDIDLVFIAARGTSDHAAIYGKYIIEYTLGIPVALAAPSILTIYKKKLNLKNSQVIGISQSGEAEDVLEVIGNASEQNALSVSITNFEDSPLAKAAKYHLHTNAGLEKSVAATKTFTAQIMLIALLVAKWSGNEEMLSELKLVPENLKRVLALDKTIIEKVQRYRYMEDGFVLSRGINYPIALEGALKIQETTYVKAKGYAISDFHHGPFAMTEENTPFVVFAPEGPSLPDAREMIEKLKSVGAEIIIVTNVDDLSDDGALIFNIPKTSNDMVTPFYNVVWAQMFACQLALAKGQNPDQPRGLNKVTITR